MEVKSFSYFCKYDSTDYNQIGNIIGYEKMDFECNASCIVNCRKGSV